jgi:hypothetical protein
MKIESKGSAGPCHLHAIQQILDNATSVDIKAKTEQYITNLPKTYDQMRQKWLS